MPSKAKKHSKTTPCRPGDPSSSPWTPSSLTSPPCVDSPHEDEVRVLLREASRRYPSLIGDSAFVGQIADVDSGPRGCKVWLSESSMVANSLAPASLVSVAIAATGSRCLDGYPLCSLSDECKRRFGVECVAGTIDKAGNYFALATVLPSSKVIKNEVRMSSDLSHTMGCPASGRTVFIYCVRSPLLAGFVNGDSRGHAKISDGMFRCESKELYLDLVPLKDQGKPIGGKVSETNSAAATIHGQSENGLNLSPKTPLSQTNIRSSSSSLASGCQKTTSSSVDSRTADDNALNIEEVLKDENSKQLLQTCAASWLYSRTLLHGNLVAIPILSKLCIFHVTGPNRPLLASSAQLLKESGQQSCLENPESAVHVVDALEVNAETKVHLRPSLVSADITATKGGVLPREIKFGPVETRSQCCMPKLGGLNKEYRILMDIITSSMNNSLSSLGLRTAKGVLLHGPPGTGKTALTQLCVRDAGVELFTVNGPEIISQYYGESEQAISKIFESASEAAPAVVFIDELDSIAPARTSGGEELSQRMVASLLNLMDGISRADGLMVIAATSRPDSIEPALRRPGRFDREIEIGVPSPKQRFEILQAILGEMDHSLSETQVQHIAVGTHGFVGADLAALCNEAALICLRRYSKLICKGKCNGIVEGFDSLGEHGDSSTNCEDSASSYGPGLDTHLEIQPSSCLSESGQDSSEDRNLKGIMENNGQLLVNENDLLKINLEDFENARMKVRPSAMREVILEVPKVNWEDVGGQSEVKMQLMEAVEWPQKHQDAFRRIGTRPPTGILLFGPPGCSKTLMARAVASEAGLNFLAVKGPELLSKWVGESEKAVRSLFSKARANAPSIVFFDEIDALAVIRGKESDGVSVSDRVMSQLLVELDGLHQRVNVTVIAATNRPDKIDPALLRPGRFDRLLYVGPPNESDREEIFRIHLRKIPCSSDVSIKELAQLTGGCTGAVISSICREAAIVAMEEDIDASIITMKHLKAAITRARPSEIQAYEDMSSKFHRLVLSNRGSDQSESQMGPPMCSDGPRWSTIWAMLKSTVQYFFRFLG